MLVRDFELFVVALLIVISAGCSDYRRYKFTMYHRSQDGEESLEKQIIYAPGDSVAYSKAMSIYFLALRVGDRMNENARMYILKPVKYTLFDDKGRDVDSILGPALTRRIRESKGAGNR